MGVVIPVGFAQVNVQFTLNVDPEPMVVTFGLDAGGETDPTVLADLVHDTMEGAGTIFQASSFSDAYTIGPHVATIQTLTGPQIGTGTQFTQGTNSVVDSIPNNTAVLVQKRTARGGRKGRGRAYFPPIYPTEAAWDPDGTMDPVPRTAWQTAMEEFLAGMSLAGNELVLLHSEEAGAIDPDPITSLVVAAKAATQRTRMRR